MRFRYPPEFQGEGPPLRDAVALLTAEVERLETRETELLALLPPANGWTPESLAKLMMDRVRERCPGSLPMPLMYTVIAEAILVAQGPR